MDETDKQFICYRELSNLKQNMGRMESEASEKSNEIITLLKTINGRLDGLEKMVKEKTENEAMSKIPKQLAVSFLPEFFV